MQPSQLYAGAIRLFFRYVQRYTELPALIVLGIMLLFVWFLISASPNSTIQSLVPSLTHYVIEVPLKASVNPNQISLNITQMMTLFTFWGIIYFLSSEIIAAVARIVTKRQLSNSRLWLFFIIASGYGGLIGLYAVYRQASAPISGVIQTAILLVVVAGLSLGVSQMIALLEKRILKAFALK